MRALIVEPLRPIVLAEVGGANLQDRFGTALGPELLRALGPMMAAAKMIFHDVQLEDSPNPVRAMLSQLRTLADPIRQKTHLHPYGDSWDNPMYDFVNDEFAGFADPQRRYTLWD